MKKLLLSLMALSLLVVSANAGVWSAAQGLMAEKIDAKLNQLETAGVNPRAYVFTLTKGKNGAVANMQCIIVYTESDLGEKKGGKSVSPVMQCVKL